MAEWTEKPLGEYCDLLNGYAFKSEDYVADGVLNFRVVNVNWDGTVDISKDRKYLPATFADSYKQYLLAGSSPASTRVGLRCWNETGTTGFDMVHITRNDCK